MSKLILQTDMYSNLSSEIPYFSRQALVTPGIFRIKYRSNQVNQS